jgi:hypothetical protein
MLVSSMEVGTLFRYVLIQMLNNSNQNCPLEKLSVVFHFTQKDLI